VVTSRVRARRFDATSQRLAERKSTATVGCMTMLRTARRSIRAASLRQNYAQTPHRPTQRSYLPELGLAALTVAGTAYFLLIDRRAVDHFNAFKDKPDSTTDVPSKPKSLKDEVTAVEDERDVPVSTVVEDDDDGTLVSKVWGSNKYALLTFCVIAGLETSSRNNVLLPSAPSTTTSASTRTPTPAPWLADVALRDLALGTGHAACVDARGDVYQWGTGFASDVSEPKVTLKGKVCPLPSLEHHSDSTHAGQLDRTLPRFSSHLRVSTPFPLQAPSTSLPPPPPSSPSPQVFLHRPAHLGGGPAGSGARSRQAAASSTSSRLSQTPPSQALKSRPLVHSFLYRY
jgi:hypothetical protein